MAGSEGILRKMPPVRTGDDGVLRYLRRDVCWPSYAGGTDVSVDALLHLPLAELVPGEKAEGLRELGRVSINLPAVVGSETTGQVLAQLSQKALKYINEVSAFALVDDFDSRFILPEYGGLSRMKQVILYTRGWV